MIEGIDKKSFCAIKDKESVLLEMSKLYENQFGSSGVDVVSLLRWKYLYNPFGVAQGLLYRQNSTGDILTMRMFTPWMFNFNNNKLFFLQPSDSATSDKYKGKGLFSKLTLESLEKFSFDGVFNFPNNNSIGIYKKLKFSSIYEIKPRIVPIFTTRFVFKSFHKAISNKDIDLILSNINESKFISTDWTVESLRWRFLEKPSFVYYIYMEGPSFVIYKLNPSNNLLVDVVFTSTDFSDKSYKSFKRYLATCGVVFFRYLGVNTSFSNQLGKELFVLSKGSSLNVLGFALNEVSEHNEFRLELAETDFS